MQESADRQEIVVGFVIDPTGGNSADRPWLAQRLALPGFALRCQDFQSVDHIVHDAEDQVVASTTVIAQRRLRGRGK
ncbi:hypothetical protein D3C80_1828710 [compost metagenome]